MVNGFSGTFGWTNGMTLSEGQFEENYGVDPSGLSTKIVGWVVKKVASKKNPIIKVKVIKTQKELIKTFFKNGDVLVKGGAKEARSIAKKIAKRYKGKTNLGKILRHDGHLLKNGAVGAKHVQFNNVNGKHIFYTSLLAALNLANVSDGKEKTNIIVNEIYTNELPGDSIANAVSAEYWFGKVGSYIDYVNPGALVAMGGNMARDWDRERRKQLLGLVVTIVDCSRPTFTVNLDPNGHITSVLEWKNGNTVPVGAKNIPDDKWKSLSDALVR